MMKRTVAVVVCVWVVCMWECCAIESFLHQCLCEKPVSGVVSDCCCDVDTVEDLNANLVAPKLSRLVNSTFFRFFKVDLYRDCPFWNGKAHPSPPTHNSADLILIHPHLLTHDFPLQTTGCA